MIRILLFFSLTSSVWTFGVENVYEADEDGNITFIWDSQLQTDVSLSTLICSFQSKPPKVLFVIKKGVEAPKSQHEQFTGRVQSDKDALRGGRIKLQLFRVTAGDAGNYSCDLMIWKLLTSVTFIVDVTSHSESSIYVSPNTPKYEPGPTKAAAKQRERRLDMMLAYAQAVIILTAAVLFFLWGLWEAVTVEAEIRRCYRSTPGQMFPY
ncbi:uncharacterized protein LOC115796785 [Archocentrus centrarchus]|uniref:uncharacterized protein LOC115796785 n=1 Tax=Archocentrus centrarchus TaxID=63155 RepID=UPI0011E9FDCC|nr:uncharacterized protein LOC115796785 [Archocentrus centrarchus]